MIYTEYGELSSPYELRHQLEPLDAIAKLFLYTETVALSRSAFFELRKIATCSSSYLRSVSLPGSVHLRKITVTVVFITSASSGSASTSQLSLGPRDLVTS